MCLPVELADGRMSMKKQKKKKKKKNSYLIYNILNLGKMTGKPFS